MLPLSFKEYVSAFPEERDMQKLYNDYVFKSSFPYATQLKTSGEIKQYLDGIYDSIKDHNPKYLLTMDTDPIISYNGIKKINVLDWLLNKKDM